MIIFYIWKCVETWITKTCWTISISIHHIMTSISGAQSHYLGGERTASWRCSVRDNLPNSWLIASLSSEPLLLANAAAICFTWTTAPAWNPPKVSTAKGRNSRPSWRQASSVSLSFRWTALLREAPGSTAPSTFEAANGLVTVTSIAASLPFYKWDL